MTAINRAKKLINTYIFCMTLAWRSSKLFTLSRLAGSSVTPLCVLASAFVIKHLLDILSAPQINNDRFNTVLLLLICGAAITAFRVVSQKLLSYATTIHNEIVLGELSLSILRKATNADIMLYDQAEYYDMLDIARNDTYAMTGIVWSAIDCVVSLFSFLAAAGILAGYNPLYALAVTCAALPSAFYGAKFMKLLYFNDLSQANNQRKQSYYFAIGSCKEYACDIRQFNLGDIFIKKYRAIFAEVLQSRRGILRLQSLFSCAWSLLPEIVVFVISVQVARNVLNAGLTVGDFTLYASLMAQVCANVLAFTQATSDLFQNALKVENIKRFEDFSAKKMKPGDKPIKSVETIEFKNVSFSYTDRSEKVLSKISFHVANQEKVALVGTNGAGKSTIVKLLLRLYDVDEGEILINGINIKEYNIDDLRNSIGVYFQNALNFIFPLRENIDPAEHKITQTDEMIRILTMCAGEDILKNVDRDLDMYLGKMFDEKGAELSFGQHQKVALARTLYKNASALVLDEPSSALDPEAEERVFQYLEAYCADKTTIFISHKLSNVNLADSIIFLENGRILEQGPRPKLIEADGRFAALYAAQAARFHDGRDGS